MPQEPLPAVVTMMAVAPNGNYLALVCENGTLVFMSCSFDTKLLEFETPTTTQPNQLAWCGEVRRADGSSLHSCPAVFHGAEL